MKTLVIPDIHMQTHKILYRAKELIEEHGIERVVFLGDYFDSWNQQMNAHLYQTTCYDLLKFNKEYNCTFLLGNHDVPYIIGRPRPYSCPLIDVRNDILQTLKQLKPQLACDVNGWLCSHAGYIKAPNEHHFNNIFQQPHYPGMLRYMDDMYDSSSLWIRPDTFIQRENVPEYPKQLVGHTSVREATHYQTDNGHELVVIDTWSITPTGHNFGDQSFAIIDDDSVLTMVK